jgi:pSer/pThr/pTyr-binding forkhead associated (FHA) protein/DNA-binding CsgD family transcriptional regulator
VLNVWHGGTRFAFEDGSAFVGRNEECEIRIDDPRISRRHLELARRDDVWWAIDLESANGSFANGRRIGEVVIGQTTEIFLADPEEGVRLRIVPTGDTETVTVVSLDRSRAVRRIGRALDNDIVIDDPKTSRYHAEFYPDAADGELRDLGSVNGTRVEGARIDRQRVAPGARIEIGDATLRVIGAPAGARIELVARGVTVQAGADDRDEDASPDVPDLPVLSDRERQVLALLAGGATDAQIAARLFIALSTVRSHLDRIRDKTGLRRRPDLTRLAFSLGIDPIVVDAGPN